MILTNLKIIDEERSRNSIYFQHRWQASVLDIQLAFILLVFLFTLFLVRFQFLILLRVTLDVMGVSLMCC